MDNIQKTNPAQTNQANRELPGAKAVERITKALKKFNFSNKEIAGILFELDMAVQEEIGQEFLDKLPEDKRALFEKMVEEGKPQEELGEFFKGMVTEEDLRYKIERILGNIADDFEQWLATLDLAEEQARKEIIQKLIGEHQQKKY